jgi:hypothetical protein
MRDDGARAMDRRDDFVVRHEADGSCSRRDVRRIARLHDQLLAVHDGES